jgi:hypothetical protein
MASSTVLWVRRAYGTEVPELDELELLDFLVLVELGADLADGVEFVLEGLDVVDLHVVGELEVREPLHVRQEVQEDPAQTEATGG